MYTRPAAISEYPQRRSSWTHIVNLTGLALRLLTVTPRLTARSVPVPLRPVTHSAYRLLQLLHALPTFDLRFLDVVGPGPPRSSCSMLLPWMLMLEDDGVSDATPNTFSERLPGYHADSSVVQ